MIKSMFAGVSGLRAHQVKMDNIANNISNVNTDGFKKTRVNFTEMMNQTVKDASGSSLAKGGTNAVQIGLGVQVGSQNTINTQGNLKSTGRNLDLAIAGEGYFIVSNGGQSFYTRNGILSVDKEGNLVNGEGLKVNGKLVNENGEIPSLYPLEPIKIPLGQTVTPKATNQIKMSNNLDSSAIQGQKHITSIEVFDNLGGSHVVELEFAKGASNGEWDLKTSLSQTNPLIQDWLATNSPGFDSLNTAAKLTALENANDAILGAARTSKVLFASDGTLDEDATRTANGTAAPDLLHKVSFTPKGGNTLNVDLKIDNLTQYSSVSTAMANSQNGNPTGILKAINFNDKGEVYATFSNGFNKKLGVVALATFSNPEGLKKTGGSLFEETTNSGIVSIGVPGENDKGSITPGYVESSNVDLSEELTEMIVVQRGYSVNGKVITTSDEMLQELVNIKR